MSSPRRVMLDTLKQICKDTRNGKYFVKRGAINWMSHDFAKMPEAISIQLDRVSLFKQSGINDGIITLEMFASMKTVKEVPEIEDEVMDQLLEDAEEIFTKLMQAEDGGDAIVLKMEQDSTEVVESHDVSLRVQGIVVSVPVSF